MSEQKKNSDFAILYRTNAQSRAMEDALRKKDIPYRIFGGLSFYQRKEIKDILAYLRLVVNDKDEESLKRIINYPSRGIGQATIDKIVIAARNYNVSLFEIITRVEELELKINSGTLSKLSKFSRLIKRFQIENEKLNAFEIADLIIKNVGFVIELKKDATPEGVARIENVEELLNGIRDFTEGQKEIVDASGNLDEFLQDIALATDLDSKDNDDNIDRVSLMTIHLAKGLEFPFVFIVGLEEDLFPSAMSMNTRSELEEERRLFYVALTRAKQRAFLSHTISRYRWGKLIDSEPSRFIEEIDSKYVHHIVSTDEYNFKPLIDNSIFDSPKTLNPRKNQIKENLISNPSSKKINRLKSLNEYNSKNNKIEVVDLIVGTEVEHARFGKGIVEKIEGKGVDKKAIINFNVHGSKNLLLRFAKLKVL
tara:strand:- start:16 stop:1287 length:1272 start_codon:yes stop_codon:yes gene_type:complete